MISVEQVSKHFANINAVNNISFEVEEGENLVLLGTSGCGKTTTLRMINRLVEPSQGTIKINGKNVCQQTGEMLRRNIGYVLQHNALFPHYTVAQNIAIVPQLLNWDKNKIQRRTEELMNKLHLDIQKYLNTYPAALSGGQQQRVNVARALAAHPPVLLMDEPFGALDPVTRSNIVKEFSELDEFKKKTIVMVTHDVQEAFQLGDRICLMDNGRIMQIDTPEDLLFKPANDHVKKFLKGQYLQLALKTIKLESIWSKLPDIKNEANAQHSFSLDTSIWDVMESMTQNGMKEINITNKCDNESKLVRIAELLTAFNEFKNQC